MVKVKKSDLWNQPNTYEVTPYPKTVEYIPTQLIAKFLVKGQRYAETINEQNSKVGLYSPRKDKSLVAVKLLSIKLSTMVDEVIISIYDKHIVIKPTSLVVKLDTIFIDPLIMFGRPLTVKFKYQEPLTDCLQDCLSGVVPCHSLTYIPYFSKDHWFYDLPLYSRIVDNGFVIYDYGCYGCAQLLPKDHILKPRRVSVQSREYPQDICTDTYEVTVYDNNARDLLNIADMFKKVITPNNNDNDAIVRKSGLMLSMPPCVGFFVKITAFEEFVDKINSISPEASIVYSTHYMVSNHLSNLMEAEAFLLTEIKYLQYLFLKGERDTLVESYDDITDLTLEDFASDHERYNYYLKAVTFIPEIKAREE